MRITAGEFRSRVINVPNIDGLRPTSSRVREALFNMLGDVEGWHVLDLFSGSGVISLEALSRGAACAVAIEHDKHACRHLHKLAKTFAVQQRWEIHQSSLPNALKHIQKKHFDWVFADPPYHIGMAEHIPLWLQQNKITTSSLVIEESVRANPQWPQGWQISSRRYGDTNLFFLQQDIHT